MLALVNGIEPRILNLKDVLDLYLQHRQEVLIRRVTFDLEKAKERAHILEGIAKALTKIDDVIETIKNQKIKKRLRII